MYLLTACTASWLCLIGAFFTTWIYLPTPRSTTDLVVIIVVGTATVLSSRLGVVSLLTLLIRLLPTGRVRTIVTKSVLRIVPTMLRSSVLAAASASLAVHSAQASPLPVNTLVLVDPNTSAHPASAPLDPGWPTTVPDDLPPDPGWPTAPPTAEPVSPDAQPESPPGDSESPPAGSESPDALPDPAPSRSQPPEDAGSPGSAADADRPGEHPANAGEPGAPSTDTVEPSDQYGDEPEEEDDSAVHIVGVGESLWSIAVNQPSSGGTVQDIVDNIYSSNRGVIGADPNLIMPGQRLEIQP